MLAVRTQCQRTGRHLLGRSPSPAHGPAPVEIPDVCKAAIALAECCQHSCGVGAKLNGLDEPSLIASEHARFVARTEIPQDRRTVGVPHTKLLAVGTDLGCRFIADLSVKYLQLFTCLGIPQFHLVARTF